ncbi:TonB-dependent receptor [Luteimonas fraxinea]|uniref:TonB-dependent receptor n=1 Tax=Luteimonas fraxinea TaxID=2901869 RepID=UPI001E38CD21|nr:TonB-dependent receptor [Luteimonas fraxinea]MCD9125043.1 TonB-dependent receptor [Luteimonas fraxinea]
MSHRHPRRCHLALLIAASLSAPCAFAQDAQSPRADDAARMLDRVIVTAQRGNQTGVSRAGGVGVLGEQAAEDVPFGIRSFNAALILNQQPQTLGQVLENDPSVRTTYGFGNAAEQFVVRGFALAGDDIGYDGLYGILPRQLVAPELYESVQVLNGASAFLNGAAPGGSGIGGSVNLVPKRAGDTPLNRVTLGFTSPGHSGASFDIARRVGGDAAWGLRVNGATRGGDVAIDDEDRQSDVLGLALDYTGNGFRASLDLAYQDIRVERLRPKVTVNDVVPRVPDADLNYGQPWQYTELRDVFGQLRAEWDIGEHTLLYGALGARDGREDGVYSSLTLLDADTGDASVSGSFIPRTDNNEAATVGLRTQLDTGPVSHALNVGVSANWLTNRNAFEFYADAMPTNLYNPVDTVRPSTVSFVGGDLSDPFPISKTRLTSAFVSDTLGFLDDRVLLTAGARLQKINVRSYSNVTGALTAEYDEQDVTPVFGVVYKPIEGVSLYANRIESLVQGGTAPVSGANPGGGAPLPVSNAGEVLKPYVSRQTEVGVKFGHARLNAGVALFQTDRETAFLQPDPATLEALRFGPFGEQRNRGIEFSAEATPVDGLRMIGGVSILDTELRRTVGGLNQGNDAVGVPDLLVNANVEWDVPALPALTLTGRAVHTGEQAANLANTTHLDSWTRFDIGARYVALVRDHPLTLRFNIDNITDERYWASAFDSFRPDLLQGAPRTFKLSASIDF